MAETLSVTCDRCKRRIGVPKRRRSRIRWPRDSDRPPYDMCIDCAADLLEWLGLAPAESDQSTTSKP